MRIFVAVPLPDELKERLGRLGKEIEQDGIKPVNPGNMHITLKFLGDTDEKKLGDIEKSLREVSFSRFTCNAKNIGVFPSQEYIRVVWAGAESGNAMESLAEKVNDVLDGYGEKEQFSSHITIARVKRRVELGGFLEKHAKDDFGSFEVSRFELMQSELRKEGPVYSVLASFEAE